MTAVQTAAGKDPVIIGKPSKTMFEHIKERYVLTDLLILTKINTISMHHTMLFCIFSCNFVLLVLQHSISYCPVVCYQIMIFETVNFYLCSMQGNITNC